MNMYIDYWHERTTLVERKLQSAPGDALLVAAIICYLGTFEQEDRDSLLTDWKQFCLDGVDIGNANKPQIIHVPVDDNFSFVDILSSDHEQMAWKKKGLPSDSTTLTNALIARACCFASKKPWPILIDPHDQAADLVRCLEDGMPVNASSLGGYLA